jgi:hypothetical protein
MRKSIGIATILLVAVASTGVGQNRVRWRPYLRINWSDRRLDAINGVNFTLWKPRGRYSDGWMSSPGGTINGLAVGLSLGLGAVLAGRRSAGLTFGRLASISEGSMYGIHVGGLALVAEGGKKASASGCTTGRAFSLESRSAC